MNDIDDDTVGDNDTLDFVNIKGDKSENVFTLPTLSAVTRGANDGLKMVEESLLSVSFFFNNDEADDGPKSIDIKDDVVENADSIKGGAVQDCVNTAAPPGVNVKLHDDEVDESSDNVEGVTGTSEL